ncbi:MFS transporter [Aquimarina sp. ERC-38]|uniref:Npt1/Npt2 family nucleotide transporter n=1 Tax=Aquimarina sp. ERC-38 TaxID=2949996 RepID=UPI0022456ED6|nr:Npt1/Npt2 family nucleotide transporter [Aquimarina sp. ERC-38]UZO80267.1 MFS transporter [Aquimarina sp. ERC-38]
MLKTLFKKTFDIRDGEIRISFFMQLYIFLIITVLLIVKPTVTALFLSKLGASHLPYAYMIVAIVAVIASYFYNRLVKKVSLQRLTMGTLFFFSMCFLVFGFLLKTIFLNNWILYVYYILIALFAVLTTSQFWLIANLVYNAREAKRLFGFIGSGAIAGGIFGGYLTTILAPITGNQFLIILAACLILLCIPILKIVWFIRIRKLNKYAIQQRQLSKTTENSKNSFQLILNSKHLSLLALIIGVSVIMAKLVDFQFSDFASVRIPDSDQLASFFGFWFSTFNVLALVIQLFLTNRVLGVLGVSSTLLILPLTIALGCLIFLAVPELAILIIIKGLDGSFKQSLNKAAVELSILPIPYDIKNSAKAFIDVVVDSLATGIAGLILVFIIRKWQLDTTYITIIILFFLFVWVLLIYKLREAYFDSFRQNLQLSLSASEENSGQVQKENNLQSTFQILNEGSETEILVLLDRLTEFNSKNLKESIIRLLDHPSHRVKTAAVNQLYAFDKGTVTDRIEQLLWVQDDELVVASLNYLLLHTDLKDDELFKAYLDHEIDYISNAALLCLAKEAQHNLRIATKYQLDYRINEKVKELSEDEASHRREEIAELLITIGYARIPRFYSYIGANLHHKDEYIIKHAIKAAGLTASEQFVLPLLSFLKYNKLRKKTIRALQSYGPEITQTVLKMDSDDLLKVATKKYIPKIVESFYNQNAVSILVRFLRSKDIIVRVQASKSLLKIKRKKPVLQINRTLINKYLHKESISYKNTINSIISLEYQNRLLLEHSEKLSDQQTEQHIARNEIILLLKQQLDLNLTAIFNLLSLLYDQTDIKVVYDGLKSDFKEAKMNAIEFLDNMLQTKVKMKVLPLIEFHTTYMLNQQFEEQASVPIKEEMKCLLLLLKNRGKTTKLAVLNLVFHLKDHRFKRTVRALRNHKNPEVVKSAFKVLEVLN